MNETFISQLNLPTLIKEARGKKELKTILDDTHGCVKPGEMMIVLGRPGSGCTTLLKVSAKSLITRRAQDANSLQMLSNRRHGYAEVEGDIKWGTLDTKEAVQYRGQIVMNTEEGLFYPTLSVGETIDFASKFAAAAEW